MDGFGGVGEPWEAALAKGSLVSKGRSAGLRSGELTRLEAIGRGNSCLPTLVTSPCCWRG